MVKVISNSECLSYYSGDNSLHNDTSHCTENVPVKDLRRGDIVLTLGANGGVQGTRVAANKRHAGSFPAIKMTVSANGVATPLTVTTNHVVLVEREKQGIDSQQLSQARDLALGDVVRIRGRGAAVVDGLEKVVLEHKNELITMDGTVIANGVHVTTMCGEYAKAGSVASAIETWKHDHALYGFNDSDSSMYRNSVEV